MCWGGEQPVSVPYLSCVGWEQLKEVFKEVHLTAKSLRSCQKDLGVSSKLSHVGRYLEAINEG